MRRKFILIETGDYFDTVLLPAHQEGHLYARMEGRQAEAARDQEEADAARASSRSSVSNPTKTRSTTWRRAAPPPSKPCLDAAEAQGADGLKEQYMLRYMLDVETRGSQSLLNVQAFRDPTAYKLKVKRPGIGREPRGERRSVGNLQLADRPHRPAHRRATELHRRV